VDRQPERLGREPLRSIPLAVMKLLNNNCTSANELSGVTAIGTPI
jgi:hypothetical protein